MSNPPEQVWKAPEGYEWTGDVDYPRADQVFAEWRNGLWHAQPATNAMGKPYPILRRLKPEDDGCDQQAVSCMACETPLRTQQKGVA